MSQQYTITILSTDTVTNRDGVPISQSASFLITDGVDTYLYSAGGIPLGLNQADILSYLNDNAADMWRQILEAGFIPLTPEQLADIQDELLTQQRIDDITADVNAINGTGGLKNQLANSVWNPLTNAQKIELLRTVIQALFPILIDLLKSVKMLLKWKKKSPISAAKAAGR